MQNTMAFRSALMGLMVLSHIAYMPTSFGADKVSGELDEIVVTATRHAESISKVAVSITALSQETLDQKGIKDFQDIVRFMPGVSIDNSGTNAISIRGIASSGGAGTTGIYIDDTPIQMRAVGFSPDDALPKTFDLERVEVLRGPQGTLFGAGSEGGTVRYLMTQPSLTTESTYARTEMAYTKNGQPSFEAGLAHGGPLVDNVLGYRASIWYRYDGGWINHVDPTTSAVVDKNANHANTLAARLSFIIQPREGVTITPALMYQNARQHDNSTFWPAYSNASAGQFNNATPERMPVPDEYFLPSLKIEVDLGKTSLIANTSYYHRKELSGYQGTVYDLSYFQGLGWASDAAYTAGSCGSASSSAVPPCSWYPLVSSTGIHLPAGFEHYATPNLMTNQQQTWAQEVRWQSNDPASQFKWTVGAFWSLSAQTSTEELQDTQIIPLWDALFGVNPLDFFSPGGYSCNGQGTPVPGLPNCDIYYNHNKTHDRQLAGFGEVTYSLSDRLKLTVGGRLAKMGFDLNHHSDGLENYGPSDGAASQTQTAFTPKLSLSFQADQDNLYYTTYAKGFRPGGGNAPLPPNCSGEGGGLTETGYPTGAPLSYNSDTTQSYEIGSKNNFNHTLRIATSAYYIKWSNIQQNVYVAYNCGLQFTDNLGTAIAKGFDIQADLALGSAVTIDAAFGYTSARYSSSTPAPKPLLVQSGDAIAGEAAINGGPGTSPPWTLSTGMQYNFSANDHDSFIRLDWQYSARNHWLAAIQDPATVQYSPNTYALSSTQFASLRAGVTLKEFQISAFVDNVLNSHTTTNYQIGQLDANNPAYIANPYAPTAYQQNAFTFRPRTVGITVTYRK